MQTERQVIGVPAIPGQTPRSLGLMVAVAAHLGWLIGGLLVPGFDEHMRHEAEAGRLVERGPAA
jgi:hypothetical protein